MRTCPTCGNVVPEPEARFCGVCGSPVAPADAAGTAQPATPGADIRARRPDEAVAVPRPVSRPTDSVATSLQPSSVAAEPGGIATVSIRVRNTGTVVDELRIGVEGPIAGWAAVDTPVLRLMPGTDASSTIRLKPPILPLALAGSVPFLVRVESREHPEEAATETGVLTVGEVRSLAATVVPATAKASGGATYEVRVENRGNVAAAVVLTASDPDEALDLELDPAAQSILPGATLRLPLRARPRQGILLGAPERRLFQVAVAGDGGSGAQAGGTLVQTARLPSWAPTAALVVGGIAVLALAGFALGVIPPKGAATPAPDASAPVIGRTGESPSPDAASAAPSSAPPATPTAETVTEPPTEPPTEAATTAPPTLPPPDACVDGYTWRLVTRDDHVCVTPATAAQVAADNAASESRWTDGAFGPHTCVTGFVWRVSTPDDDVCVTSDVRTLTAFDNTAGPNRIAPRTDTCIAGFAWREVNATDHVCVSPAVRDQVVGDNLAGPGRSVTGVVGGECLTGWVWRAAYPDDLVCVTPEVRQQAADDNAAAAGRVAAP